MKTITLASLLLVSCGALASAQDFDAIELRSTIQGQTRTLTVDSDGGVRLVTPSGATWTHTASTAQIASLAQTLPLFRQSPARLPGFPPLIEPFELQVRGGLHAHTVAGDRFQLGFGTSLVQSLLRQLDELTPFGPEVEGGVLKGFVRSLPNRQLAVQTNEGAVVPLAANATSDVLRPFLGLPVDLRGKLVQRTFRADRMLSPTRFRGQITLQRDAAQRLTTARGDYVIRVDVFTQLTRSLETLYNVHGQRDVLVQGWTFPQSSPGSSRKALLIERLFAQVREGVHDAAGRPIPPGKQVEVNLGRILTTTIQVRSQPSDPWVAVVPDLLHFAPQGGIITRLP